MQVEWNLVETSSNTSFTWPATFGRKPHSPPYNILHASLRGLNQNVIFPRNFCCLKILDTHIFLKSSMF
jgi:hypothetical protein